MSHYLLQHTTSECGLACIGSALNYFGSRLSLADLREKFPTGTRGTRLDELIFMAHATGLVTSAIKLERDELSHLRLPAILHWDKDHYVLLLKANERRITIHDPAQGLRRFAMHEVAQHFNGVALELAKSATYEPMKPKNPVTLRRLIGSVSGVRRTIGVLTILALGVQLAAMILPLITQWILDQALVAGDKDLLWLLIAGFVALNLIQQVLTFGRSTAAMTFTNQVGFQWSSNVMLHLLHLPISWYERRHPGDIMSRFQSVRQIQQTAVGGTVETVVDGVFATMALGMMYMYSGVLTLICVAALALYGCVRLLSFSKLREASAESLQFDAREKSLLLESLRAIQSIKVAGLEKIRYSEWQSLAGKVLVRNTDTQMLSNIFTLLYGILFSAESAAILGLGAWAVLNVGTDTAQWINSSFTVGMLIAFISYKDQFSSRMRTLIDKLAELYMIRLHTERLADIVLAKQESLGGTLVPKCSPLGAKIELKKVGYRHSEREPWIFRNVSLKIEPGEHVALIGASGAGKTTLMKIILGLLTPSEGVVLVNGEPLARYGLREWRACIGAVLQDDHLFSGSIRQNIASFADAIDDDDVMQAARLAGIHQEVKAMPMGYYTRILDLGSNLSGGQKQRVLIARALYSRPALLAMDEATSHLDIANEMLLNHEISKLSCTRLVVAHRPDTIRMAGRIIDLASFLPAKKPAQDGKSQPAPIAPATANANVVLN